MNWVLYILIGYAGSHSTMTEHGKFKTEEDCKQIAKLVHNQHPQHRYSVHTFCLPKEKNGG